MSGLLHGCGGAAPGDGFQADRSGRRASSGPVIDVHCHILCPQVEDLVAGHPAKIAEAARGAEALGAASVEQNMALMGEWRPKLVDPAVRLADMDHCGIDRQVLSPSPTQYYYWAEPDLADAVVSAQNQAIAEMCALHPDRFTGMAAVSLQHPEQAAKQLRYCVRELGFRGVEISSHIDGRDLGDPHFAPFWQCAEELGVVVFLHPLAAGLGARGASHYLSNLIGVPLETTLALAHMIFGGVLDRHTGLKLVAAHGGGFMGSYWARFDHGWSVRPECRTCAHPPSHYLKHIHFDSIMFEPAQLRALIEFHGADRILMGSDYPFDMGLSDPVRLIEATPGLSTLERERILGKTAAELFGIKAHVS